MWHKKGVMMLKIQLWSQKSIPFYNTGTSQKWEYQEEGQYFLSLVSESETHILYRYITQSEIFQAFISWHFDDYGLQIMKTQNSVSQLEYYIRSIKKMIF